MAWKEIDVGNDKYVGYKDKEAGDVLVTGHYRCSIPNTQGNGLNHKFSCDDGFVILYGAKKLDDAIESEVREGDLVQVIYGGKIKLKNGNSMHLFKLRIDTEANDSKGEPSEPDFLPND